MAQVDLHLKLEGILGESKDAKNNLEIQIDSFRLKAETPRDASTGFAAGACKMSTLTIRGKIEQPTAKLFDKTWNHQVINKATLTGRKAGKVPLDFLIVELTEVLVMRVEIGDLDSDNADLIPACEFDLSYGTITVKTQGQTETGLGSGFLTFSGNLMTK
jgi:type VI secretion system secreted protein Hcp